MKLPPPIAPASKAVRQPASSRRTLDSSVLTVNNTTALLHCHRVTLLRLIERGQLHAVRKGTKISFQRAEVSALANRNIAVYPHLTLVRQPQ
jgi:excisionase family DNA binding protein